MKSEFAHKATLTLFGDVWGYQSSAFVWERTKYKCEKLSTFFYRKIFMSRKFPLFFQSIPVVAKGRNEHGAKLFALNISFRHFQMLNVDRWERRKRAPPVIAKSSFRKKLSVQPHHRVKTLFDDKRIRFVRSTPTRQVVFHYTSRVKWELYTVH